MRKEGQTLHEMDINYMVKKSSIGSWIGSPKQNKTGKSTKNLKKFSKIGTKYV